MKKPTTTPKKLALDRQTLRTLQTNELERATAGRMGLTVTACSQCMC